MLRLRFFTPSRPRGEAGLNGTRAAKKSALCDACYKRAARGD